jgi:nucleoid DNA-binding protein
MRIRQGLPLKLLLLGSALCLGLVWFFHARLFPARSPYAPGETFTQHLAGAGKANEAEVQAMLRQLGPALAVELRRGRQVDLPGLGSFQLIDRPEYQALDRSTGQLVLAPGGRSVLFVPEQDFMTEVSRTDPLPEPQRPPEPVQPAPADPSGTATTSWARP